MRSNMQKKTCENFSVRSVQFLRLKKKLYIFIYCILFLFTLYSINTFRTYSLTRNLRIRSKLLIYNYISYNTVLLPPLRSPPPLNFYKKFSYTLFARNYINNYYLFLRTMATSSSSSTTDVAPQIKDHSKAVYLAADTNYPGVKKVRKIKK